MLILVHARACAHSIFHSFGVGDASRPPRGSSRRDLEPKPRTGRASRCIRNRKGGLHSCGELLGRTHRAIQKALRRLGMGAPRYARLSKRLTRKWEAYITGAHRPAIGYGTCTLAGPPWLVCNLSSWPSEETEWGISHTRKTASIPVSSARSASRSYSDSISRSMR